ncbi:MAG: nuclear transport factor 2 family protein [Armatimonadetes bacterium]|nr:nuclear transport factor 2 family protein [Armatimonadota bacterium]
MRKIQIISLFLLLFVLSSCVQQVDFDAEKEKVNAVLDICNKGWETQDLPVISNVYAHDSDMIAFGTDLTERFVGWEDLEKSLKEMFASFNDVTYEISNRTIKIGKSGDVAWFTEIQDIKLIVDDEKIELRNGRNTGVLEKRDGKWLIIQSHFSLPVEGQAAEY